MSHIDLKSAMNAISDVIANRPPPLRQFDQIYMKAGDMVMQAEFVAQWADGKKLCFIGDGDGIGICSALLKHRGIYPYGPANVTVLDFDERVVNSVNRIADKERMGEGVLDARKYNVLDALPADLGKYDCFYTNPPWGQYNEGRSVDVFVQRGIEAISNQGEGLIVIAGDLDLAWPARVLSNVQRNAAKQDFFVGRMQPGLHLYHLDDAPDLRSCNLVIYSLPGNTLRRHSEPIRDESLLEDFYGRTQGPRVRYVVDRQPMNYNKAGDSTYEFVGWEDEA